MKGVSSRIVLIIKSLLKSLQLQVCKRLGALQLLDLIYMMVVVDIGNDRLNYVLWPTCNSIAGVLVRSGSKSW
jgi:hypothetical protein